VTEDVVVHVEHLSKRFKLYSSTWARLGDWLRLSSQPRYQEFWALRDVSWELRRGECLGIIGPNGAGKSTLLKLLTGALHPTSGSLEVQGRVLSLLELGTGFNTDLTGRQNVELSARLLGFQPGYAATRLGEIEAFAELGDFFDRPVKFYSSGMLVRLAFSLFSTMQPDVFMVDEALAVGDMRFASKAFGRIRHMLEAGTTLLFVSHDLQLINRLCTRAIWLHTGTVQMDGDPAEVTRAYQQFVVHGGLQAGEEPEPEPDPGADLDLGLTSGEAKIHLGAGWCELEAYAGEVFRWTEGAADVFVSRAGGSGHELLLDLEPGPSAGALPARLVVLDARQLPLAEVLLEGRQVIRIEVPRRRTGEPERITLRPTATGGAAPGDVRKLVLRVFGWGWSDQPALRSIQHAGTWVERESDLDLVHEFANMEAALQRCAPVAGRSARFTRIVTRNAEGREAVRFAMHEPVKLELAIEASADVDGLIIGLQLRDAFDRMISGTRSDWQRVFLPYVPKGKQIVVEFTCPDMILGPGVYQFTVAISQDGREDHISHWVDGAWRFEVISSGTSPGIGLVDMRWRFAVAAMHQGLKVRDPLPVR
jgi:ABC-type polysaccharide/polyol phosphate transport system ATPase subunit